MEVFEITEVDLQPKVLLEIELYIAPRQVCLRAFVRVTGSVAP